MSRRVGLRFMQSVGGKAPEEVGSFLLGGYSSPLLGYAVLLAPSPSISRTGDLTDVVPVDQTIWSIGSNGVYWLVGFDRYLYRFDGVTWTLLDDEGDTAIRFESIKWNGEYWLIVLRNVEAIMGVLGKYDGETFEILEDSIIEGAEFFDLAWSPTVNYWLAVGRAFPLPTVGKAWKWDGVTLTDISDKVVGADDTRFDAVDWFDSYWLLGGHHHVEYKQLKKYNPVTDVTQYIIPPRPEGDISGRISCIKSGGGIALIGEVCELGPYQSLYKWDGANITILEQFEFHEGGVYGIEYAEGLFFIVGTDKVVNYETYFYPKIRTYNKAKDLIETISPPWDTGSLNATAYTSKVF